MHDSDFGCLEVKSAAGPSDKPVSSGMHMCSSLTLFLLSTVLMLNGTTVLIFFFLLSGLFSDPLSAGTGSGPGTHIHHAAAR